MEKVCISICFSCTLIIEYISNEHIFSNTLYSEEQYNEQYISNQCFLSAERLLYSEKSIYKDLTSIQINIFLNNGTT